MAVPTVKFIKLSPDAPDLVLARPGDVGYDLTLTARTDGRIDDKLNDVNMFHSGISMDIPSGYYVEMFARSSLHKQGYILATGTSIIDTGYQGEIMVPLIKYKESPDLELPARAVQLVVKKKQKIFMARGTAAQRPTSERGTSGFGSSGGYSQERGNRPISFQTPMGGNHIPQSGGGHMY